MKKANLIFWGSLLMAPALVLSVDSLYSQDLKAELDALDDLPEDDMSGLTDVPDAAEVSPTGSSSTPKALQSNPSITAQTPKTGAPTATSSFEKSVGVGDLDLQGLEEEIKFDSFKGGPSLSVQDLNQQFSGQTLNEEAGGVLTALDFKQMGDRVRLVMKANRPIDWTRELRSKRRQVVIELRNLKIGKSHLSRPLDTGEFDGPVALVQAFPSKVGNVDSVKVLFQLRQFVDPTVLRTGNELVVDFPISAAGALFTNKTNVQVITPKTYMSANDFKEFKGSPISLNVKNADLADVLNLISKSAGKSFVPSSSVADKKVTVNLNNVPWDQALGLILFNNGLGFQDLENIYRIATKEELTAELDAAKAAATKTKDLIPEETRLIPVSYAKGDDVLANIKEFLTKDRGRATVEKRTNTLVVTDIPEVLDKIDRYVKSIDRQTPQILIEARIVEATEEFNRLKNFNWGVTQDSDNFEGGVSFGRRSTDAAAAVTANQVNLRFSNLAGIDVVDAILAMSEQQNRSKTIASPRITVLANEPATIKQGSQIPLTVRDEAGNTTTEYKDVDTSLTVTPQVTADNNVLLDINLTRKLLESTEGAIGNREAKTKMLVESGKTAVIGGLYVVDTIEGEQGFPFLRGIPIFGTLFQNNKQTAKKTNELLMFISPRILNSNRSQVLGTNSGSELYPSEASSLTGMDESAPASANF